MQRRLGHPDRGTKITRDFGDHWKVMVTCKPGSHLQAEEISKQVNDKERYLAALENEDIARLVEKAIADTEW